MKGFTIIELLMYLGLFSLIIGGGVVGAYNIFESVGRAKAHAMLQEEGNFIMQKINWAVAGAQAVNGPANNAYSSQLSVNKVTGIDGAGQPIITTITFSWVDGKYIQMQDGANLNNTNIEATHLGFLHTVPSGTGVVPESIVASTTLETHTPDGRLVTEDFSTTVYVHR